MKTQPSILFDSGATKKRNGNSPFVAYGLYLQQDTLKALEQRGIYCQSGISLEHQHLAKRYVLCGIESGGAVADMGRYCAYLDVRGQPLPWLQPIDSIAVNGRHAVLIASELVRIDMLRVGRTYELAISKHSLAVQAERQRPIITSKLLFRGNMGTLALELWKEDCRRLRGTIAPVFYSRAGEARQIPSLFEQGVRAATGAVSCIGCKHTHIAIPPMT
jgi:hypothetical protein